jgi:hypothetical protein
LAIRSYGAPRGRGATLQLLQSNDDRTGAYFGLTGYIRM